MTEKSWFAERVVGALLATILFVSILIMVIMPIVPFKLDMFQSSISGTLIRINDYAQAGANAITLLWGYRGIDSILQGLVLTAAAIGAATLFRLEKKEEDESKED